MASNVTDLAPAIGQDLIRAKKSTLIIGSNKEEPTLDPVEPGESPSETQEIKTDEEIKRQQEKRNGKNKFLWENWWAHKNQAEDEVEAKKDKHPPTSTTSGNTGLSHLGGGKLEAESSGDLLKQQATIKKTITIQAEVHPVSLFSTKRSWARSKRN